MFDEFTHLVENASGWAYAVVLLFAVVDALIPLVPSETAVITAGVVAGSGQLSLPLVIIVAAVGALSGDNIAYALGRRYGERVTDRYFDGANAARRLAAAKRQLKRRGGELIAVGRFVPGGRTLITLTAGLSRYPWPKFARFDAIAAVLWASYGALLGYFGGHAFENEPWKGLLLALGIAFVITLGTEAVRHALRRRKVSAS